MKQEIYVKEMPKNCLNCPCSDEDYERGVHCNFGLEQDLYTEVGKTLARNGKQRPLFLYETLPKDCPLKSLHNHDKELVAKVLESVKNEAYKDGFYDEDGNKIITYHINNYILDQIQKEFEDGE